MRGDVRGRHQRWGCVATVDSWGWGGRAWSPSMSGMPGVDARGVVAIVVDDRAEDAGRCCMPDGIYCRW